LGGRVTHTNSASDNQVKTILDFLPPSSENEPLVGSRGDPSPFEEEAMPWNKIPTHQEWSTAKKGCGSDDLVRDQWHIGKHLEDYHKLHDGVDKYFALVPLARKFKDYKDALNPKAKTPQQKDLVQKIATVITWTQGKRQRCLTKYPKLKEYVDLQKAKAANIFNAVELGKDIDS
jgi:hypothetical protein